MQALSQLSYTPGKRWRIILSRPVSVNETSRTLPKLWLTSFGKIRQLLIHPLECLIPAKQLKDGIDCGSLRFTRYHRAQGHRYLGQLHPMSGCGSLDCVMDCVTFPLYFCQPLPQIENRRLRLPGEILGLELFRRRKMTKEVDRRVCQLRYGACSFLEKRQHLLQVRARGRIASVRFEIRCNEARQTFIIGTLEILLVEPFEFLGIEFGRRAIDRGKVEPFHQLLAAE